MLLLPSEENPEPLEVRSPVEVVGLVDEDLVPRANIVDDHAVGRAKADPEHRAERGRQFGESLGIGNEKSYI